MQCVLALYLLFEFLINILPELVQGFLPESYRDLPRYPEKCPPNHLDTELGTTHWARTLGRYLGK